MIEDILELLSTLGFAIFMAFMGIVIFIEKVIRRVITVIKRLWQMRRGDSI